MCSIHLKWPGLPNRTRIEKNYSSEQRECWKKSPHSQSVSHEAGRVGTFLGQKYNEVIYTGAGCVFGKVLRVVLNSQFVVWVDHNLTLQKTSMIHGFATHLLLLPKKEFWVFYLCVFFLFNARKSPHWQEFQEEIGSNNISYLLRSLLTLYLSRQLMDY